MKYLYLLILTSFVSLQVFSEEEKIEEIVSVGSSVSQKKEETNTTIDVIEKKDLKRFASNSLISILNGYLGIDTSSNGVNMRLYFLGAPIVITL